MRRMHVHVGVRDLDSAITFYNAMFAAVPVVVKDDYAKWMLDDPRVNFAISVHPAGRGLGHLGFQVDAADELSAIRADLEGTGADLRIEEDALCCYAVSDKVWVNDPAGLSWEMFHTTGEGDVLHPALQSAQEAPIVAEPAVKPEGGGGCCG